MGTSLSSNRRVIKMEPDLTELERDYLEVVKKSKRTLYLSVESNPYNIGIALQKKKFKKVTAKKTLVKPNHHQSPVNWKDYLLKYFTKRKGQGQLWYVDIIQKINSNLFLNENNYLSMMFYQGYALDTKPELIEDIEVEEEVIGERAQEEVYDGDNPLTKESLNKLIANHNLNLVSSSRIDLTKITENLGGSFSSKQDSNISAQDNKDLIKKLVKLFKQHVIDVDHPINQVIQLFEQALSSCIKKKTASLERMRDSNEEEYNEAINGLCSEVVFHIQMFVIKTQAALKLFYSGAVNFQCLYEEKDELINLVSGILFKTGSFYNNIYALFSMQMRKEVFEFEQTMIKQAKSSRAEMNIDVKFRLNEDTTKYMEELKKQHNDIEIPLSSIAISDEHINGDKANNHTINVTKSSNIKINNKFYKKNPMKEYNTAIKILRSLKYNSDPFEKIMLISLMGSEVTDCVSAVWKGMTPYISSSFLTICPDDLMAIYIYIIMKADMPEILIHERIIREFTTSTTQLSIMGYHYTTLQGAIDYIQRNNPHQNEPKSKVKKPQSKEEEEIRSFSFHLI